MDSHVKIQELIYFFEKAQFDPYISKKCNLVPFYLGNLYKLLIVTKATNILSIPVSSDQNRNT
jgi:hypothetical protein